MLAQHVCMYTCWCNVCMCMFALCNVCVCLWCGDLCAACVVWVLLQFDRMLWLPTSIVHADPFRCVASVYECAALPQLPLHWLPPASEGDDGEAAGVKGGFVCRAEYKVCECWFVR